MPLSFAPTCPNQLSRISSRSPNNYSSAPFLHSPLRSADFYSPFYFGSSSTNLPPYSLLRIYNSTTTVYNASPPPRPQLHSRTLHENCRCTHLFPTRNTRRTHYHPRISRRSMAHSSTTKCQTPCDDPTKQSPQATKAGFLSSPVTKRREATKPIRPRAKKNTPFSPKA